MSKVGNHLSNWWLNFNMLHDLVIYYLKYLKLCLLCVKTFLVAEDLGVRRRLVTADRVTEVRKRRRRKRKKDRNIARLGKRRNLGEDACLLHPTLIMSQKILSSETKEGMKNILRNATIISNIHISSGLC